MKAVSIMFALVTDSENRKLFQEVEVIYEDGTLRSLRVLANRALRLDLDQLYKEIPPCASA